MIVVANGPVPSPLPLVLQRRAGGRGLAGKTLRPSQPRLHLRVLPQARHLRLEGIQLHLVQRCSQLNIHIYSQLRLVYSYIYMYIASYAWCIATYTYIYSQVHLLYRCSQLHKLIRHEREFPFLYISRECLEILLPNRGKTFLGFPFPSRIAGKLFDNSCSHPKQQESFLVSHPVQREPN